MTSGRGAPFDEGPAACPFVALDTDRERRADQPDARHRCYATPTPEPRAIGHQRAYCLTPNFTGCPIFQDWAVRAAARPVPMRPMPSMPPPMTEAEKAATLRPPVEPSLDTRLRPEQVSLFELTRPETDEPPPTPTPPPPTPTPAPRRARPELEPGPGPRPAIVPAPAQAIYPPPTRVTPPAVPAVSNDAGRPRGKPGLGKEDIVPSWERARYDVPPAGGRRSSGGGDLFSRLTVLFTALAVLAMLALVALLVPVLFGARPGQTPAPSDVAVASPTPTASPTSSPTPEATWMTYTIKPGDNLFRIAEMFNLTYEQLIAANPQITDPNFIRAGDVINIPPPDLAVPSPSGVPAASP